MSKTKIERLYGIFSQASTIDGRFDPKNVTMHCDIFIGGCLIEKRMSLHDVRVATRSMIEEDATIWNKADPKRDAISYRSQDYHTTIYADIATLVY